MDNALYKEDTEILLAFLKSINGSSFPVTFSLTWSS